ncbi:hypothetical protein EUX98_g8101 [Antrodiella citrinella]|uniref:Ribonuclease H1 N-terminal domain-containing protein n=1 Tax=Antrodiella citrinella TaxID=2447956 RepID=A0A4S4MCQ9_9APHY|nr:hypothetical protein EUX98_g8101 [Antrodiella citrinella]
MYDTSLDPKLRGVTAKDVPQDSDMSIMPLDEQGDDACVWVVWEGRQQGLFYQWDSVLKSIERYPDAQQRKFCNLHSARIAFYTGPYFDMRPVELFPTFPTIPEDDGDSSATAADAGFPSTPSTLLSPIRFASNPNSIRAEDASFAPRSGERTPRTPRTPLSGERTPRGGAPPPPSPFRSVRYTWNERADMLEHAALLLRQAAQCQCFHCVQEVHGRDGREPSHYAREPSRGRSVRPSTARGRSRGRSVRPPSHGRYNPSQPGPHQPAQHFAQNEHRGGQDEWRRMAAQYQQHMAAQYQQDEYHVIIRGLLPGVYNDKFTAQASIMAPGSIYRISPDRNHANQTFVNWFMSGEVRFLAPPCMV